MKKIISVFLIAVLLNCVPNSQADSTKSSEILILTSGKASCKFIYTGLNYLLVYENYRIQGIDSFKVQFITLVKSMGFSIVPSNIQIHADFLTEADLDLVDELEKNYNVSIQEMKKQHDAEIQILEKKHEMELKNQLENAKTKIIKEMENKFKADIQNLKNLHEAELRSMEQKHQAEIKKTLVDSEKRLIVEFEKKHAIEIQQLKTQHQEEIQKLHDAYMTEFTKSILKAQFKFYYVPVPQRFGIENLRDLLKNMRWNNDAYELGVFDCSEMSAFLEWRLENEGFHSIIVSGEGHAWVMVETSPNHYTPVEATSFTIENHHRYYEYIRGFENIQDALGHNPSDYDWWDSYFPNKLRLSSNQILQDTKSKTNLKAVFPNGSLQESMGQSKTITVSFTINDFAIRKNTSTWEINLSQIRNIYLDSKVEGNTIILKSSETPFLLPSIISIQMPPNGQNIEFNQTTFIGTYQFINSGCLIFTALYGSPLSNEVQFFRHLRDKTMVKIAGQEFRDRFNSFYYSFSPEIADYIRENPWIKAPIILILLPIMGWLHAMDALINSFIWKEDL